MGRATRLEEAARRNPVAVRLDGLRTVLESAGWHSRPGAQGHWIFTHARYRGAVNNPEPHGKGDRFVKAHHVRQALAALDQVRREQDEGEE